MDDKVICPWCGNEMKLSVVAATPFDALDDTKYAYRCFACLAESPIVYGKKSARSVAMQRVERNVALESELEQVRKERDVASKIIYDAITYLEDLGSPKYCLIQLKKWRGLCKENEGAEDAKN